MVSYIAPIRGLCHQPPGVKLPGVKLTPRRTCAYRGAMAVVKSSPDGSEVADSWSVTATSWFASAPWSPPPLTVEVIAQMLTVPLALTLPVRLRRPSVAGAHGRPVAALLPDGRPATLYGWPRFRPDCSV